MKKFKNIIYLFSVLTVAALACNIPSAQPEIALPPADVDVNATLTSIALMQNPPPVQQEFTATATLTPTITLTGTPTIPMVSVSTATNCRKGPGVIYDYVTALLVGEKVEIIGKHTSVTPPYWIVKIGSVTCWLWGQYATVEGDTSTLPEMVPPPSPTPVPTDTATSVPVGPNFSLSFNGLTSCSPGDDYAVLKWVNTGSVVFESAKVEIKDLDTSSGLYGPSLSNVPFGSTSPGCGVGNSSLGIGNTAYSAYYIGAPAPAGHKIRITVTMCSQDGALGDCAIQTLDSVLP